MQPPGLDPDGEGKPCSSWVPLVWLYEDCERDKTEGTTSWRMRRAGVDTGSISHSQLPYSISETVMLGSWAPEHQMPSRVPHPASNVG